MLHGGSSEVVSFSSWVMGGGPLLYSPHRGQQVAHFGSCQSATKNQPCLRQITRALPCDSTVVSLYTTQRCFDLSVINCLPTNMHSKTNIMSSLQLN
jgi:hypothetical protein